MGEVINPLILYLGIALGGVGVCLALPRRGVNPQLLGGLLAGLAAGIIVIGLAVRDPSQAPNLFFYIFGALALGSALRVISHKRPVYAALYFILTILSTAGLFLILSAEFMAFALIIVYAGAILITYLFVLMLATQSPSEEDEDALADYDARSREPLLATVVGFVLLAALTSMMFRGVDALPEPHLEARGDMPLRDLPRRVERSLLDADLMERGETIARHPETERFIIDPETRTVVVQDAQGATRTVEWPEDLKARNVEGLAMSFLNEHPATIEIAGVVLLMALLGAVVLSRRQIEADEKAKRRAVGLGEDDW